LVPGPATGWLTDPADPADPAHSADPADPANPAGEAGLAAPPARPVAADPAPGEPTASATAQHNEAASRLARRRPRILVIAIPPSAPSCR
jgi:hypothetical protein